MATRWGSLQKRKTESQRDYPANKPQRQVLYRALSNAKTRKLASVKAGEVSFWSFLFLSMETMSSWKTLKLQRTNSNTYLNHC